jgi:hypothetical protein
MTRRTLGGVVLHVTHIGAHDGGVNWRTILRSSCRPFSLAATAPEVVYVLQRIARRILATGQQRIEFPLAETAALRQLEIVDVDAFLLDRGGVRRHRARRDAADIGMVAARGHPEQDRPAPS